MKRETLVQSIIIIILSIILICLLFFVLDRNNYDKDRMMNNFIEEEVVKETSKDDVDSGNIVNDKDIKLDKYDSNITINEGGEYNISGSFKHSIIVDSNDIVKLNLKNVKISSSITAAIANRGNGEMVINIVKGTTNVLEDNGSSEFDGCIYSNGKLTIEGSGVLKVYGNQEEGEGIATTDNDITINGGEIYIESKDDGLNAGGDSGGVITINGGNIIIKASGDGIDSNKDLIINGGKVYTMGSSIGGDAGIDTDGVFEINGGEVIAIGSDMLQIPNKTSKQKYISFTFNSNVNNGTSISLKDEKLNEILTFEAKENFKTLIVSNSKLKNGIYSLYIDDEKTEYNYTLK